MDAVPLDLEVIAANQVKEVNATAKRIQASSERPLVFSAFHCEFNLKGAQTELEISDYEGGLSQSGSFDARGNLIRLSYRNRNGREEYAHEFSYDSSQVLAEKRLISGGEITHRLLFEIQASVVVAATCVDGSGQLLRKDKYNYDGKGRVVELDMGYLGEWKFEYDDQSCLVGKFGSLASPGPDENSYRFTYHDNGLLQKMERIGRDIAEMQYEFFPKHE